jgi:predicted Zn-dependent peptidase
MIQKEVIQLHPGLKLHLFQTPLFKTTTIKIFIDLPLDETASANALSVRVLSRGCRKYPTLRKMSIFLDSLYGAIFGADVSKIGEHHIMEFFFEFISKRFTPKNVDNTRYALNFLKQVIFRPLLIKEAFQRDYFSQEQQKLKDLIKSVYDDKMEWADERCVQEMCKNEAYRFYEYGEIDKVDKLTADDLLRHYYNIVLSARMNIFISGHKGVNKIARTVSDIFKTPKRTGSESSIPASGSQIVEPVVSGERLIKEHDLIDQTKLVLGFRTNTTWKDREIFGLMMASGILGGFPHSKLFRNIREKYGLAYYVGSTLEKTKGLMFIRAGVNHDKIDEAIKVIKQEINSLQTGEISDEELNNTRAGIMNRLNSIQDNASSYIDYNLELGLNNRSDTIDDLKKQFLSVKKEDIISSAQKIKLDTVYCLTSADKPR